MSEKKGFTTSPMGGPGAGGFVPAHPQHHAAAAAAAAAAYAGGGASPYAAAAYQGLYPPTAQQQNAAQAAYDQQQAILAAAAAAQHMYPAAAVGGAVYPQAYSTYPSAFTPVQAYYPLTAAAYSAYPQMRPTVVIPAGYDGGARFDGIAGPVIPGPPPGMPPTPAQLAAMAGHNVALTKKQGNFLTGSSDGGYAFW